MAIEFDIVEQASAIAEQAWDKWEEVNNMAALQELEHVSRLLDQVTARLGADVLTGGLILVDSISKEADLVGGVFSYHSRGVDVPGRPLTYKLTRQPTLAIKEVDRVTPLAYAEDIIGHPLSEVLVRKLEALNSRC